MMAEVWRPIDGYDGTYEVSNLGRIRRVRQSPGARAGRILAKRRDGKGYLRVALHSGGRRDAAVHRLVALAFLGVPPTAAHQVNHIDGDKTNNAACNLEWTTGSENLQHSYDIGIRIPLPPERNAMTKLNWPAVQEIRRSREPGRILAERFGVSVSLIGAVRRNDAWHSGEVADTLARLAKARVTL